MPTRRFRNQVFTVIGTVDVLGRRLESLALRGDRLDLSVSHLPRGSHRWIVFDPKAGPHGNILQVYRFSHSRDHRQHLGAMERATNQNRQMPQILQYDRDGRDTIVVTSWIHGVPFKGYLDSVTAPKKRPSVYQLFRLYNGLSHGLCQLHSRAGLVHGDVHPGNLVLAAAPANHLALVDFGSAWKFERTTQRAEGDGHWRGYEAPELIRAERQKKASDRCDQFSAGVVFYEMLTGVLPFDEMGGRIVTEFNASAIDKAQSTYVPPGEQLRSSWHRPPKHIMNALNELVAPALQLRSENRYPSKSHWLNALQKVDLLFKNKPEFGFAKRAVFTATGFLGRLMQTFGAPSANDTERSNSTDS